jgi:hypothetical protein
MSISSCITEIHEISYQAFGGDKQYQKLYLELRTANKYSYQGKFLMTWNLVSFSDIQAMKGSNRFTNCDNQLIIIVPDEIQKHS